MRPLTRSCFLLLVLGRLFLLALPVLLGICLPSRWSPPFLLHALALIPLFLAKVRLSPTLTLSPLMIWCFGQTALFLLARAAPAFLPTALSVALRPLFPFRQAQYAQVFSAEACAILHSLCWSRQHQQVCHFSSLLLLSDSHSVLAALSSPSFLLSQTLADLAGTVFSPPVLFDYNGSPDTRFSRGTTRPMSWPDGMRYLHPPLSLVVSLLLPVVSTLALSRTGGVLSLRSILTHRFPRFSPRSLCSLVMLAVSSLVFAATDTAFF